MSFKVELSDLANTQYDKILAYIYHVLENPQAADSLMQDFDDTIEILEKQADHFGYCRSEKLRKLGFHKIHLQKQQLLPFFTVCQRFKNLFDII